MVGRHHRLNGHEFEQDLGDGVGQGSLACCGPWGHKEQDTSEQVNNNILFPFLESCIIGKSQCMLGKNCVGDIHSIIYYLYNFDQLIKTPKISFFWNAE